jgi:hypothetical protein
MVPGLAVTADDGSGGRSVGDDLRSATTDAEVSASAGATDVATRATVAMTATTTDTDQRTTNRINTPWSAERSPIAERSHNLGVFYPVKEVCLPENSLSSLPQNRGR